MIDKRWRKVTKKHPGKKWEYKPVLVAHRDLDSNEGMRVVASRMPSQISWGEYAWGFCTRGGIEPVTHWMPFPDPPPMPKEKAK
jgi:hypothetical protein